MMKVSHWALFVLLNFCLSLHGQLKPKDKIDVKTLDSYFSQMQKEWNIPGVSIGIVKNGKIVFTGNYGQLEVGNNMSPDENTLYAIASNSKAFTATILAMLVEEGKVHWNDKVKEYLPYFELYDPWVSSALTIRDMLSHRSGLGTFSGDIMWYKSNLSAEQILRNAQHLPKAFDFRAGFGYSNIMYIAAGQLIEKVTGKSWGENVQDRILNPLGMDRTVYSLKNLKSKGNFATPHSWFEEKNTPISWVDWEKVGALGGLISSVSDISKWMIFNMNRGIWNGDTLLNSGMFNTLWTPHNNFKVNHAIGKTQDIHFSGYGLGWSLTDYNGKLRVRHTGGFDGMISAVTLVPEEELGVVVLTNGMVSPIRAATLYALDKYLGKNTKDWSKIYLEKANAIKINDTRISDRKSKRVMNTKPSLPLGSYAGKYRSAIFGEIEIRNEKNDLKLIFENSKELSASLEHWHYDIWEIKWDYEHAWFSFGTVGFELDNNLKVKGMEFDVPNQDIFFEELKPYKME